MLRHVTQLKPLLRNGNFMKLWGSQVFSKLADNFITFAIVILVYEISGKNFYVSLLVALVAVPPIVLSTFAGVVADSYNRRTILVLVNTARAALITFALLFNASYVVLIIVAVTATIVTQFFTPTESATIPTLVDKKILFLANSFFSMTNYGAFLLGYSIAGPILGHYGDRAPFMIAIGLYIIAALLDAWLPPLRHHLEHLTHHTIRFFKDFRIMIGRLVEGVRYVRTERIVLFVIFQVALVFSIERAFISLVPSFSQDVLQFSVEQISTLLILPTGIGTLVGALLANRYKYRVARNRLMTFGMCLDGVALFLLVGYRLFEGDLATLFSADLVTVSKVCVWILAFVSGFADPFIIIPAQTSLQLRVPEESRGRVFGVLTFGMNVMGIIAVLIIGGLADALSLPIVISALAVIILAVTAYGVRFYRKHPLGFEAPPEEKGGGENVGMNPS